MYHSLYSSCAKLQEIYFVFLKIPENMVYMADVVPLWFGFWVCNGIYSKYYRSIPLYFMQKYVPCTVFSAIVHRRGAACMPACRLVEYLEYLRLMPRSNPRDWGLVVPPTRRPPPPSARLAFSASAFQPEARQPALTDPEPECSPISSSRSLCVY